MVTPAMQLAGKISDVHVQLWASSLLKGKSLYTYKGISSKEELTLNMCKQNLDSSLSNI